MMCRLGLRHHHHPAGVLVQPVDDAGALLPADARQLLPRMGEEGVHQRPVLVARRRMHDQPGRLVQHNEMRVLVQDGQGDRLSLRRGRFRRRDVQAVASARTHRLGRVGDRLAVPPRLPGLDQRLDTGSRQCP